MSAINYLPDLPIDLIAENTKNYIKNIDLMEANELYNQCKKYLKIKKFPCEIPLNNNNISIYSKYMVSDKLTKAGYRIDYIHRIEKIRDWVGLSFVDNDIIRYYMIINNPLIKY